MRWRGGVGGVFCCLCQFVSSFVSGNANMCWHPLALPCCSWTEHTGCCVAAGVGRSVGPFVRDWRAVREQDNNYSAGCCLPQASVLWQHFCSSSSVFSSYVSGVHHFGVRFLCMWSFLFVFNPTLRLSHSVFVNSAYWVCLKLPPFTRLRHECQDLFESVGWNECVHRLDLGLYSHPKEFWGCHNLFLWIVHTECV